MLDVHLPSVKEMPYDSFYAVFLEQDEKSIIIVTRGTITPGDCLTDGDSVEFDGKYHRGFYLAANLIFEQINEKQYFKSAEKITFTGYSMGGSISTMLQVISQEKGLKNTVCYAYSPAPCINEAQNNKLLTSDCYSFVIENDVVPRASKKAIKVAFKRVKMYFLDGEIKKQIKVKQLSNIQDNNSFRFNSEAKLIENMIKTNQDLILGGKIYWIYKGQMYLVDASAFNDIQLQLLNAFDHAAGTFYIRQLEKFNQKEGKVD